MQFCLKPKTKTVSFCQAEGFQYSIIIVGMKYATYCFVVIHHRHILR